MQLKEKIAKEIKPRLAKAYGRNIFALPRITKVTLNCGTGRARERKEFLEMIKGDLAKITGQKAAYTVAKKSISAFKTRQGQKIGYRVTLQGTRMWDFIERLVNVTLPRLRDFDGISPKSFDRQGNFTLGVAEALIFPEVNAEDFKEPWGMSLTFTLKNAREEKIRFDYLKKIGFIIKER